MIMQAAFFKLTGIIPVEDAVKYLKGAIEHSYGKKGQKVLDMNYAAVDQGIGAIKKVEVPAAWAQAKDEELHPKTGNQWVDEILTPMNMQEGDKLPISKLMGQADWHIPIRHCCL